MYGGMAMDPLIATRIRRNLIWGLIASVITVLAGELPIGWVKYPNIDGDATGIIGMLLGSADLSLLQLASGALFGGIFIPLQYFGFKAAADIVALGGNPKSARIIRLGAVATALWGGIVHVVCVALMFVCRLTVLPYDVLLTTVMEFLLCLVLPISIVFLPMYYAMTITLFLTILRGRTCLPRWAALFNPLLCTFLINALPMFAPNMELINALSMANMGIGSILTFGGFLCIWLHFVRRNDVIPLGQ